MKEKIKKTLLVVLVSLVIIFIGFMWIKEYNLKVISHNLRVVEYCIDFHFFKVEKPDPEGFQDCLKMWKIETLP